MIEDREPVVQPQPGSAGNPPGGTLTRAGAKTQMHIGFTGTRHGMSFTQRVELRAGLTWWKDNVAPGTEVILHHGDCVGADEEADALCAELGIRVWVHPPTHPALRAFCTKAEHAYDEAPDSFIARNHDIVKKSELMYAAPLSHADNSGTWATIRYAQTHKKKVVILRRKP